MEWSGAAECLPFGAESPFSCPDGYLWRQRGTGKFHAACLPHLTTSYFVLCWRSHNPANLTRVQPSSTRTHANRLRPIITHGACSPPRSWTMSVLCSLRSSHQDLPRETSMPSGENDSTRTRCFHIIPSSSTTTYFRILCYSLRPCQLGLLRELHIQSPPNSTQPTPKAAAPGAPSRDHSRKAAWAWKG